jgi:signal transduction histidine kinase
MRLQFKLALIEAISKIALFFILLISLGQYIEDIALQHTDKNLVKMKDKTMSIIHDIGIRSFLNEEQDSTFASYNILKDEYVTIELDSLKNPGLLKLTNEKRIIENNEFDYRILNYTFKIDDQNYSLEVGRNIELIYSLRRTIKNYSIQILLLVLVITILSDIGIFKYLLRPLNNSIIPKLKTITDPEKFDFSEVKTTTADFLYLNDTINEMMSKILNSIKNQKKFIANVAHELFTPISIMQNKLENIITSDDFPQHLIPVMIEQQNQLSRLNQIIKALLLISRIENDQYIRKDEVNVYDLVEEVISGLEDRAEIREIKIENQIGRSISVEQVNKSLLYILIFNLVNNAIKYNRQGGFVRIESQTDSQHYILKVKDNGIGIDPDNIQYIFDRFTKIDSKGTEGFGLGLSIVNSIVNFHQAKIEVRSIPEQGSTFMVFFPLKFLKA